MKAFVEFGHETSDTKSSSHAEIEIKLDQKWYLTGLVTYFAVRL